jgi:hypothetical protein
MRPAVLFFLSVAAFAAIDGTVVNQTTGKPQAGVNVTVFRLDQGMNSLGAVRSGEDGRFTLPHDVEGPVLLQAAFEGVTYNQMLQPGAPRTGVTLPVYNSSAKPGEAKVTQHMMLFEPTGESLMVSETFIINNSGNTTWNDAAGGTLRFHLPESAKGIVQVNATAPQGMPVRRTADKTAQKDVYKIDFAMKPGESRIDLTYLVPAGAPFQGRVLFPGDGPTRLVAPAGVELKGEGVAALGQEPRTQATIYSVAARNFEIEVAGTGSLRAMEPESTDGGPRIEQIMPRIYQGIDSSASLGEKMNSVKWIILLSLGVLTLGFILLYRAGAPAASHARPDRGTR